MGLLRLARRIYWAWWNLIFIIMVCFRMTEAAPAVQVVANDIEMANRREGENLRDFLESVREMSLDGSINDFRLTIRDAKAKAILSASEKMAGMKGTFWSKAEKMTECLNQVPFSHQEQIFCVLAAYGQQV